MMLAIKKKKMAAKVEVMSQHSLSGGLRVVVGPQAK
jgi:hypothetical protein